ncbi:MAG: hypothetical protein KGI54_12305 [Pseudomonadota bacterium]|nr:hypothetical protein [Pseudomonadota bacterium]
MNTIDQLYEFISELDDIQSISLRSVKRLMNRYFPGDFMTFACPQDPSSSSLLKYAAWAMKIKAMVNSANRISRQTGEISVVARFNPAGHLALVAIRLKKEVPGNKSERKDYLGNIFNCLLCLLDFEAVDMNTLLEDICLSEKDIWHFHELAFGHYQEYSHARREVVDLAMAVNPFLNETCFVHVNRKQA